MLLKICENNLVFLVDKIKFIDVLCCFFVSLIILLIILVRKKIIFSKQMFIWFFATIIFLILVVANTANIKSIFLNKCSCKLKSAQSVTSLKSSDESKVIIIGDSRMSLINDNYSSYNIPKNYSFIAKSGAKINWFVTSAIPTLEETLDNRNKDYAYHVVINMGVNDMNYVENARDKADEYFSHYKSLALKYPGVNFYLLSVNPVSKRLMDVYWTYFPIKSDDIELFNKSLKEDVKDFNYSFLSFCDSYHDIYFKTYDGLHYKHDTSQEVIDFISNECLHYK